MNCVVSNHRAALLLSAGGGAIPAFAQEYQPYPQPRITLEEYYVVLGFTPTMEGLAILGRSSKRRVVNVAQRGAVTAVLLLL